MSYQLWLPTASEVYFVSEVIFDSEVHFVSEVPPDGEVMVNK